MWMREQKRLCTTYCLHLARMLFVGRFQSLEQLLSELHVCVDDVLWIRCKSEFDALEILNRHRQNSLTIHHGFQLFSRYFNCFVYNSATVYVYFNFQFCCAQRKHCFKSLTKYTMYCITTRKNILPIHLIHSHLSFHQLIQWALQQFYSF